MAFGRSGVVGAGVRGSAGRTPAWWVAAVCVVAVCGWGTGVGLAAQGKTGDGAGGGGAAGGSFDAEVRAALADKSIAKGVHAVTVARVDAKSASPTVLLSINGTTPMLPASNLKLVTTSAALNVLGPDFKFQTRLLLKDGDLYLHGDGDPTLGDPELGAKTGWNYDTVFKQWAEQLKKTGVTSVRAVYVDDSIFDQKFVNETWPQNQLDQPYVAEVGGLNFYFNTIDVIAQAGARDVTVSTLPPTDYVSISTSVKVPGKNAVGADRKAGTNELTVRGEMPAKAREQFATTVHDPGLYGATVLAETLRREGISVGARPARTLTARQAYLQSPGAFKAVGTLETPISVALARCNKDSANLYAECLAKRLAAKATGQPGSWESSAVVRGQYLTSIGVPADQFKLADGCGLSRDNRVTSEMMVKVLASDFAAPYRQTLLDSLAVGGVDGTLSKRFTNHLKGRVHAKSGFINGVFCLSGFLEARNGQWYAFSVLLNSVGTGKATHERIVEAIDSRLP